MSLCDACGQERPAYGFTSLTRQDGTKSEDLCATCFNKRYTDSAGIPALETSELPPLTMADSFGKEHTFFFRVYFSTGLTIRAFELLKGYPSGYEFGVLEHPKTPLQKAYDKLVGRIKAGLSVHYLESSDFGPAHNRLYIKGSAVNGRIEEGENYEPIAVIDGKEYTWEELGRFVSSHMGFNFRLECFDPFDEIETDPNPERPDNLWWLLRDGGNDERGSGKTYQ